MKRVYICSDTITGMFSAFYDAWKERRNEEVGIRPRGNIEQELFCEYTEVQENERKATAIEKLIRNHMGDSVYHDIYHALLSEHAAKAEAVFRVMQASRMIKDSRKIMEHLSNPDVAKVFELSRNVSNEAHRFLEFIRFRELENGVLYSGINPKNRVLTCMGDHFADRFPLENWLIYDKAHREAIVYRAGYVWVFLRELDLNLEMTEKLSAKEYEIEEQWKGFFETISIKGRENLNCQRNHLPLRFRSDMTEFSKNTVFI